MPQAQCVFANISIAIKNLLVVDEMCRVCYNNSCEIITLKSVVLAEVIAYLTDYNLRLCKKTKEVKTNKMNFEDIIKQFKLAKKKKEDFFVRMENYKISYFTSRIITSYVMTIIFALIAVVIPIVSDSKHNTSDANIIAFMVFGISTIVAFICFIVLIFQKNSLQFKLGKLSSGLKSFIMFVVPLYIILLICYINISQGREIIISLFTAVTTISAAILAMMGVHYTLIQQKIERIDKNNLVFKLNEETDSKSEFKVKNAIGNINLQLNIKNISNNFGYFIGLYKLCGCDVYRLGDELPYLAISPEKSFSFTDIRINYGDDQLILVYRDIGENYYYLLLSINGDKISRIEKAGKCDIGFLQSQIKATDEAEKAVNKHKRTEKLINFDPSKSEKKEINNNYEETDISKRKEETKPNRTFNRDGFELIVSEDGEVTDFELLSALRKERLRLAKDKKIKAYMILNNQQLVALATYKPDSERSFISIYGLGKKKYDLYGDLFIQIIKEYEENKKAA